MNGSHALAHHRALRSFAIVVGCLGLPGGLFAGEGDIADNSFLIEEAFNQERGVVQHIFTWLRPRGEGGAWSGSFTQEWPAPEMAHQLSYTVAYSDLGGEEPSGLGDLAINYRYQLLGRGEGDRLAVAPRLSLVFPTGDRREGLGSGALGAQVNLPVSVELAPRWVAHSNLGGAYTPGAKSTHGTEADLAAIALGQSLIFRLSRNVNLMLEGVWSRGDLFADDGRRRRESAAFLSPGIRWAHDLANGLQIVPGLAFPIGVGPNSGERAVFLYLSLEHPFRR